MYVPIFTGKLITFLKKNLLMKHIKYNTIYGINTRYSTYNVG